MPKNSVKNSASRTRGLTPFKKGQSGNPAGRPLGARNRRTVILDAIRRIAEKKKMTVEEIEDAIQVSGIEKALKGSYMHYSEISSGLYGKITDKVDVTSGGKTLAELMAAAAHARQHNKKPGGARK